MRGLWIFASYIKSKDNKIADEESRILPAETEWELADWAFRDINISYGEFDVDLFASNLNKKCEIFVSWRRDPESIAIDAFTISWASFYFYAFPPFSIVLQTIRKIVNDQAEGVLAVPLWPAQCWFPMFNKLLVAKPLYFYPHNDLLHCLYRKVHPLSTTLTLVAGRLSGKLSVQEDVHHQLYEL